MDAFLLYPSHTPQMYTTGVKGMMNIGGVFILASCNNTVDEIKEFFGEGWKFIDEFNSGR